MRSLVVALTMLVWSGCAYAASPVVHTEDVTLFYQVYDAAGGHPTADQIQHDYSTRAATGCAVS